MAMINSDDARQALMQARAAEATAKTGGLLSTQEIGWLQLALRYADVTRYLEIHAVLAVDYNRKEAIKNESRKAKLRKAKHRARSSGTAQAAEKRRARAALRGLGNLAGFGAQCRQIASAGWARRVGGVKSGRRPAVGG